MTQLNDPVYKRTGDFAIFNQVGIKLAFDDSTTDAEYYDWLDRTKAEIKDLVEGAEIAEKSYARTEPRINTGVYYDTSDYKLLDGGFVLRTTCNPKTHAFCAFKQAEDESHVRRDHRFVFEGNDKLTIQLAPTSTAAVAIVKRLLGRDDIEHPGAHLYRATGVRGTELSPALCLQQMRHPFFVWLDKRDALRCSMDRVRVSDLRLPECERKWQTFSEIELPIYPHVDEEVARSPRVAELIEALGKSLRNRFGIQMISESKYQRAARALGLGITRGPSSMIQALANG